MITTTATTIYVADLFCGAGGFSSGLIQAATALGVDVELLAINHWDMAISTHSTNHPKAQHKCESLDNVDPRKAVPGGRLHLMMASPECFPAGTLILAKHGLLPIEDIKIGDLVYTHQNRWQPVTDVMCAVKDTVIVGGHGHYGLETTSEHPFFSRTRMREWNNEKRRWQFVYSDAHWTPAHKLTEHFWATPTKFPEKESLTECPLTTWELGRWLGDGSVQLRPGKGGTITICCGKHESKQLDWDLVKHNRGYDVWSYRETRTAGLFERHSKADAEWLVQHCGTHAHNKTLPVEVLSWSENWRRSVLEGYFSADGHDDGRKYECTTVSKKLAIGIKLLATSLGYHVAVHKAEQHCDMIEGRKVTVRPIYRVMWIPNRQHQQGQTIGSHTWLPVKRIVRGNQNVTVYNLSVAEDESYVADGIVVHNCTHHSNARGGKPMSDQSRATAWHILRWAEALYIDNLLIENVPEFRSWGPLGADGRPMASMKGRLYRQFCNSLRALGYVLEDRVLCAADYGDATTRERLFIQARRGRKSITWPEPTHTREGGADLFGSTEKWRAAREIIDWDIPGQSIFTRSKPLAENTMRRIMIGLQKYSGLRPFVIGQQSGATPRDVGSPLPTIAGAGAIALVEPKPYLVIMNDGGDRRVKSVDEPLPTVMAGAPRFGVAEPFLVPYRSEREGQEPRTHDINQPLPTATTENAFGVAEPHPYLVVFRNNCDAQDIDGPLPTICANGQHVGIAQPYLVNMKGKSNAADVERPLPTMTAHSPHLYLAEPQTVPVDDVDAFLLKYYGSGDSVADINDPLDTITARDRFGLVAPQLMQDAAGNVYLVDITFRMLTPKELAAAMSFPNDYWFAGNKTEQVKQVGNAVAVRTAAALCGEILRANVLKKGVVHVGPN